MDLKVNKYYNVATSYKESNPHICTLKYVGQFKDEDLNMEIFYVPDEAKDKMSYSRCFSYDSLGASQVTADIEVKALIDRVCLDLKSDEKFVAIPDYKTPMLIYDNVSELEIIIKELETEIK